MNLIATIEQAQKKSKLPVVMPGDTVRVHQTIREGNKSRVQVFEGVVIRYRKSGSMQAFITVRKIASGVGVEKSWFMHSPNVVKVEVVRRAKVRRAYLSYLRGLRGKKARLTEAQFDATNTNKADNRTAAELNTADDISDDMPSEDQVEIIESTEELAREEEKAAAKADAGNDLAQVGQNAQDMQNAQGDDEAQLQADETEAGIDRVENETTKEQDKK